MAIDTGVAATATDTAKCVPTPQKGPLLCDDGACWLAPKPQGQDLYGVWISPENVAWVVGEAGTVLTRTLPNGKWGYSQQKPKERLLSVGGTSSCDVWVGGANGTLRHWNGSAWKHLQLSSGKSTEMIQALCSIGAGMVMAGSDAGRLYKASEAVWEEVATPWQGAGEKPGIYSMSCRPGSALWIGGYSSQNGGLVARRDVNQVWKVWQNFVGIGGLWEDGKGNAWAVGKPIDTPGDMTHFFGDTVESVLVDDPDPSLVIGSSDVDIWVANARRTQILHWDGLNWTKSALKDWSNTSYIPAAGAMVKDHALFVYNDGAMDQLQASTWQPATHFAFRGVGGLGILKDGTVLVADDAGKGGHALFKMNPADGSVVKFADVSGARRIAVDTKRIAVGLAGGVEVFEQGVWKMFKLGVGYFVEAISMVEGGPIHVLAVHAHPQFGGVKTLFFHGTGDIWKTSYELVNFNGKALHAFSSNKVWALGTGTQPVRSWNGTAWSPVSVPPHLVYDAIAVAPDGVVWLAARESFTSILYHSSAVGWTGVELPRQGDIHGLAFSKSRLVLAYDDTDDGKEPQFYLREGQVWKAIELPGFSPFFYWAISAEGALVFANGSSALIKPLGP